MASETSLSIAIIDDDVTLCEMVRDTLSRKFPGTQFVTYNTGEDALAQLVDQPDIVVLDYQLDSVRPDAMNGIQILSKLKERFPELPVIFMSAQDRMEVASNTIKYGAYDYIVKGETAFHKLELAVRQLSNLRTLKKSHGFQKGMNVVFWVLVLALVIYIVYLRLH
ncbi:MAG: response regulator [Bacteroidota bacterium]|nr:response regulator [Bacteroidota bacterium]MDP4231815.1 response regulator [Bacteroidota bacterium]MDP4242701.1 response regulator [Bacteroidota bacterium]MDP4287152.1 response regulator [Bacteroidota bacterium]